MKKRLTNTYFFVNPSKYAYETVCIKHNKLATLKRYMSGNFLHFALTCASVNSSSGDLVQWCVRAGTLWLV